MEDFDGDSRANAEAFNREFGAKDSVEDAKGRTTAFALWFDVF